MNNRIHLFTATVVLSLVAGCTSSGLYHWGNYEDRLYKYYKTPNKADAYMSALQTLCESPAHQKKPAPGLCAEYGFMLRKAGREQEAIAMFQKEQTLWPESSVFMQRLIAANQPTTTSKQP